MTNSLSDRLLNAPVSRRQLLRLVGLGAAATAGLALGVLPARAAETGDPAEFERLTKLIGAIQEAAASNPDLAGVRAVSEWYETQPLSKLSAEAEVAVTGALALAALDRLAKSALDPEGVRARLEQPIDPSGYTAEYLAGLAEQTQAAMKDDPAYAERIKKAYEQVEQARWSCTVGGQSAPMWVCIGIIIIIVIIML